jgi:Dolichyl-phosphate-mannose-protein mannosyltransferase
MFLKNQLEEGILILRNELRNRWGSICMLLLALSGVLLHLLLYNELGFHRDELLYFSLGQHPDFGYFSVPPMIGFLAFVLSKVLGYSLFTAKIVPALLSGVMVWLCARMAGELGGSFFARFLAAIGFLSSILFLRAFSLFQPVFLDIFFWTMAFYFLLRFVNTEHRKYMIFFGVSVGFGLLDKYNILFLVMAVMVVMPLTRYRKLYRAKAFYRAIFISFLIVLPNLIWQIAHHMPVLQHLAELKRTQLNQMGPSTFLSEQLLMVFPATLLALPGLIYLLFGSRVQKFKWLGYALLVVVLLYLLLHGKTYYTAGIYPLLICSGAVFFEQSLSNVFGRTVVVATLLFFAWMILPMGMPSKSPEKLVSYFDHVAKITHDDAIRRYEDNEYRRLPQDYADMLGWEELTVVANTAWQSVEHKDQCIIFGDNYGEAGAITILGKKYNLPEAISFNDNFRYWVPKTFDKEIIELIYINHELGKDVQLLFADVVEVGRITNPLAREYGTRVYLCKHPRSSFNKFWKERVASQLP